MVGQVDFDHLLACGQVIKFDNSTTLCKREYWVNSFIFSCGVVGWCEGVLYLTSPGRPTDIGLQLGKACYPCSR